MEIKKIIIDKHLKICFINEGDITTVEIENPHPSFRIPRIGEHFTFFDDVNGECNTRRTNIVTDVDHLIELNQITIWYDFYLCWDNTTLKYNIIMDDGRGIPEENLDNTK